jgi:hypothetical protein
MTLAARLEVVIDLAGAAGAALYAAAVLARRPRPRVHVSLALLVLALGLGFGARALDTWTGARFAHHLQYLGFGVFPIVALVYAEAASARPAPLPLKLAALAATLFFAVAWPTALVDAPAFRLAMMAYQLVVLGVVAWRLGWARFGLGHGPRRSALGVMGALAVAAVAGVLSENRDLLGWNVPRAGALGLLLVTTAAACSFHAGGLWRPWQMLVALARPVAGALALVAALALLEPGIGAAALVWAGVLPVVAFLVLHPVRVACAQDPSQRAGALLARLCDLRTDSFGEYLADLGAWPEIRRLEVLERRELVEHGYDQLQRYFRLAPGPADRQALEARASAGGPGARPFEQLLDLIDRRGCDFVLPLAGGAVMTVAVDGFLDRGAFRLVLRPVGQLSRLVYAAAQSTDVEAAA